MSSIIALARNIATQAHQGTTRADGTPFISHPAAVAHHAATYYNADALTVATCWLHDVIEDTDLTLTDLHQTGIPFPVLAAINAVTTQPGEPYLDAVARAWQDPIGRLVKLCDTWHNAATLAPFTERDRQRRGRKYSQARALLLAA